MRLTLLALLIPFLTVCGRHSSSGPRPAGLQDAEPYAAYLNEFCGEWATTVWGPGREARFIEFVQRTRALTEREVSDLPFRVLMDPRRHDCWRISAQVIGFAGSPRDGLDLIDLLRTTRLSVHIQHPRDAQLYGRFADITHGLAFLAARLEEGHPIRTQIEDLLIECSEPRFWLDAPAMRIEPLSRDPADSTREVHIWAGWAMRRCIHALGNIGSERAGRHLRTGEGGLPWHASFGLVEVGDYQFALRKHDLIERYGLDGMIERGFSSKL